MSGFRKTGLLLIVVLIAILLVAVPSVSALGSTLPPSIIVTKTAFDPGLIKVSTYTLDVTTGSTNLSIGSESNIHVVVMYSGNATAAKNVHVDFTVSPATATVTPQSATTTSYGVANSVFKSNTAGTYVVTIQSYKEYYGVNNVNNVKDAYRTMTFNVAANPVTATPTTTPVTPTPTESAVVTRPPTPTPGEPTAAVADIASFIGPIICGSVLFILVIIVVLYLWMKKTLQVVPKKAVLPADGTSKIPVRVQFVNGLGMAKKMGRDTEVELESTSGTIKGTVIPSGKEYVDTELTSAKEFGPVTITAKSGNKTARAKIDFIVEKGALEVTVQPDTIPADGKSSATVTIKVKDDRGNYVAPLEDRNVDLKTTLGTVQSPVRLPAMAQSVSANLTSGEVSGTAVITATSGELRGEGKLNIAGMPKRFCMHCGAPMSLEASSCPKCSLTPPSGTDVKICPSCNTVIPEAARFCYHCGAKQPEAKK